MYTIHTIQIDTNLRRTCYKQTNNNLSMKKGTKYINQQCGSKRILEKAKLRTFHFKNLQESKTSNFPLASSRRRVVRIPSAFCEVACEQNSRGLKIAVVKDIENSCVIRITNSAVIVVIIVVYVVQVRTVVHKIVWTRKIV